MMRFGQEHQSGFRDSRMVDGIRIELVALHHNRNRLPRPSEMVHQMARRGRPQMVPETEHEWRVLAGGRMVCSLRQHDNGVFYSGQFFSRDTDIMQAAIAATRRMMPGIFTAGASAAPEAEQAPDAAPPTPGRR